MNAREREAMPEQEDPTPAEAAEAEKEKGNWRREEEEERRRQEVMGNALAEFDARAQRSRRGRALRGANSSPDLLLNLSYPTVWERRNQVIVTVGSDESGEQEDHEGDEGNDTLVIDWDESAEASKWETMEGEDTKVYLDETEIANLCQVNLDETRLREHDSTNDSAEISFTYLQDHTTDGERKEGDGQEKENEEMKKEVKEEPIEGAGEATGRKGMKKGKKGEKRLKIKKEKVENRGQTTTLEQGTGAERFPSEEVLEERTPAKEEGKEEKTGRKKNNKKRKRSGNSFIR